MSVYRFFQTLPLISLAVILENKLYFLSGDYTFEGGDTDVIGTQISASNLVKYRLTEW